MITTEIFVFVAAILFGIMWYWRESKNNKLYRFFNKLMHAKKLQMKPGNKKAFVHQQPFLMRLVWITLLYIVGASVVTFIFPINVLFVQYFVSAIAGTLIGTYIASLFFVASEKLSKENLEKNFEKAYQKGKDFVEDLTDPDEATDATETPKETPSEEPEAPKKSARDRLKDKGMIN